MRLCLWYGIQRQPTRARSHFEHSLILKRFLLNIFKVQYFLVGGFPLSIIA